MTQLSLIVETWDEKALRLCQQMRALLAERPASVLDHRAWKKWTPRYDALDYELDRHLRVDDE